MRWPWVGREELDAAMERARVAEAREEAARTSAAEIQREATLERQRLTDRILQLSGQPPVYREEQAVKAEEPAKREPMKVLAKPHAPMARTRLTADEIHEKFREARAAGQLDATNMKTY